MHGESEGDALSDWIECMGDGGESFENFKDGIRRRYDLAGKAKVGTTIRCAYCGRQITKTTYQKKFCKANKKVRGSSCKDKYWNSLNLHYLNREHYR